jgi:hypothetical protein
MASYWEKEALKNNLYPLFQTSLKGEFPNLDVNNPGESIYTQTTDDGSEFLIPSQFFTFSETQIFLFGRTMAGMALDKVIEAKPELLTVIIEGKKGNIAALRDIPKMVDKVLGSGSYGYLQRPDLGNNENYYKNRFFYVREKLVFK